MKLEDVKFRAFAGKEKGMMMSDSFDTLSSFFGFIAGQMYWDEKGEVQDYNLMRCTGLKDINETLIFEGDILKSPHSSLNDGYYKVFWRHEFARFSLERFWRSGVTMISPFESVHNYTIVGNIHANPELL